MPQIVALFACSAVSVASCLPAGAEDTAGIVEAIDAGTGVLRLADGSTYALSGELDYRTVEPGMEVHLLVTREMPRLQIHS